MLSQVSHIYDPPGLISPVIQRGKLLFQEATRMGLLWDFFGTRLWEHVSRIMHFLTADALALILSTPVRVTLHSYTCRCKDWVNVIFSYSYVNVSSVWRNCEFEISFPVNLSYWEKPYCSFPGPFYISLFAVNCVYFRFSSDSGNTVYYDLTNDMVVAWCVCAGLIRWSKFTVDDHLKCCYKCCWFISVLKIIPGDTCNVSGHTRADGAQFCECISLTMYKWWWHFIRFWSFEAVRDLVITVVADALAPNWAGHKQTQGWKSKTFLPTKFCDYWVLSRCARWRHSNWPTILDIMFLSVQISCNRWYVMIDSDYNLYGCLNCLTN